TRVRRPKVSSPQISVVPQACKSMPRLRSRGDGLRRLRRRHDRMHLELDEVFPRLHPLIDERPVLAFHNLITALVIRRHPARDVAKSLGRKPASLPKPRIDRLRIAVPKVFDDHEEHSGYGHPRSLKRKNRKRDPGAALATKFAPTAALRQRSVTRRCTQNDD